MAMYETPIKIENVDNKIKFTKHRLCLLVDWEAPCELECLRIRCITCLKDRLTFFKMYQVRRLHQLDLTKLKGDQDEKVS